MDNSEKERRRVYRETYRQKSGENISDRGPIDRRKEERRENMIREHRQ